MHFTFQLLLHADIVWLVEAQTLLPGVLHVLKSLFLWYQLTSWKRIFVKRMDLPVHNPNKQTTPNLLAGLFFKQSGKFSRIVWVLDNKSKGTKWPNNSYTSQTWPKPNQCKLPHMTVNRHFYKMAAQSVQYRKRKTWISALDFCK